MLIFGAKGLAKEVLEVCLETVNKSNIVFYDDVSSDLPDKLYNEFLVLRNLSEASDYFANVDKRFVLGLGGPSLRAGAFRKFVEAGGMPYSLFPKQVRLVLLGWRLQKG